MKNRTSTRHPTVTAPEPNGGKAGQLQNRIAPTPAPTAAPSAKEKPRHYGQKDMRWMEERGRTYYAVQAIPRDLWATIGKRRFVKSLGTRDHALAISKRHRALAEFEAEIERARAPAGRESVIREAMEWRKTFDAFERGDFSRFRIDPPMPKESLPTAAYAVIEEQADEIGGRYGEAVAQEFVGISTGSATPLLHFVDDWLKEGGSRGPVTLRTQWQYRRDMGELADWVKQAGISATIEAFTPARAGQYVREALIDKQVDRKTANRKISACSAYWRWLCKRAGIQVNPWTGQSLAKLSIAKTGGEKPKRPFTDEEIRTLLSGAADGELQDAMRIAALSGMRIEEMYRLMVSDCAGGWFRIRRSKTAAGLRRVPIHPGLTEIIERRCKGRAADAHLFPEPGEPRPGLERSMAPSKRFGHYRRRLGIEERQDGKRHSRIDFHSFRRWFVTKARNAGIDRAIVARVVGHETGNLTDDVYSGGPDDALLRQCVQSVKLPE